MNKEIGKYVKMKRMEMGLSLREFGKLCDMSHTHIDSIEKGIDMRTGRDVNLTSVTVSKLAKALGMSEGELLSLGGDERAATDRQLKLALFGDADMPDAALAEVRQFAQFIKNRG